LPHLVKQFDQQKSRIAILRLDGDMYSSTWEVLIQLYRFVPVGGFVIVDDYGIERCGQAIKDFLTCIAFTGPLVMYDKHMKKVYWKKTQEVNQDALSCYVLPDI